MDLDTDVSSHHTTNSPVDTATSITSPNYSRQSESGSRKRKAPRWSLDESSNMPTVSTIPTPIAAATLPVSKEAKLDVSDSSSINFNNTTGNYCIDHLLSSKCGSLDAELPKIPHPASRNAEELYKRSLDHFPNPGLMFPMPALEFDFRIAVTLNPELSRSENRVHKEIITVASGTWSGSFGNGRVLAGGYDLGQARGFRPIRIVEGAFVLQTSDPVPAIFEMRTRGSLSGPCNTLDALLNPQQSKEIDPRQYSFRMFSTVKAADKRYAEYVNCGLWVACGVWKENELIIDAYRVV